MELGISRGLIWWGLMFSTGGSEQCCREVVTPSIYFSCTARGRACRLRDRKVRSWNMGTCPVRPYRRRASRGDRRRTSAGTELP